MSIERTIPSSTMERRNSGSMTWVSFSVIWSLVGTRGIVGGASRRPPAPWVPERENRARGPGFRGRRGASRWRGLHKEGRCSQQASPGSPPLEAARAKRLDALAHLLHGRLDAVPVQGLHALLVD